MLAIELRAFLIAERNFAFLIRCFNVALFVVPSLLIRWVLKKSDRASIKYASTAPGREPEAIIEPTKKATTIIALKKFMRQERIKPVPLLNMTSAAPSGGEIFAEFFLSREI